MRFIALFLIAGLSITQLSCDLFEDEVEKWACVDSSDNCTDTVAANCDFPDDFNVGGSCP